MLLTKVVNVEVPTPGTPVSALAANGGAEVWFVSMTVIPRKASFVANTGNVYVGGPAINKTTGADCWSGRLLPGSGGTTINSPSGLQGDRFRLTDVYVDADTANDGVVLVMIVSG